MIPLAVLFSGMLCGFALAMAAVALVLRGSAHRRELSTPFCLLSLSMAGFACGHVFRNACPDIATADLVARWAGCATSLIGICVLVLYRALTKPVSWRLDAVIGTAFAASAITALLSPGGIHFTAIERIDRIGAGWWGPITVLRGPPDMLLAPFQLLILTLIARVAWMVLSAPLERRERLALIIPPVLQLVPIVHGFGLVYGWWNGVPLGEYTLTALYLVLGLTLWRRERELARDLLRRRQQIEAVLEHGLGLSGLLDLEGRLVLVNRTALEVAGTSLQQVIGQRFSETPWWAHSSEARRRLEEAIARAGAGQTDRFATTHPVPGGGEVDIDFSLTPYRGADGRIEYLIAEGRDISELKRYDRMVRESSKLEAVGQLAGGVAHDFNNVLAGIMGAAEVALIRSKEPETKRRLETILSAAGKAGDLTKRLLAFARKGKTQELPLSANDLARDTLELFSRSSGPELRIEQDLAAAPDQVLGDPAELQSALLNLCINARDAMGAGGLLRLTTRRQELATATPDAVGHPVPAGIYIRVEVADQGTGIAPGVIDRIFEPFFTTKPEGKGTGLGLPAVLGTAHAHSGGLMLTTTVGSGTTIALLLPAYQATAATEPAPTSPAARADGELVVLVDDDNQVRHQARELFVTLGFAVEDFADPLAARERLRSPDGVRCVVLDLAMPGCNGRDLYAALRSDDPGLPIIISSGYAGGGQLADEQGDPHLAFLPKPWRLDQLRGALLRLAVLRAAPTR